MGRRFSTSQLRSRIQQARNRQEQAISKFNQAINRYNQEARRRNQKLKQAVSAYNREARAYNSRVRARRQQLTNQVARLSRRPTRPAYTIYRASIQTLHETYVRLEQRYDTRVPDSAYGHYIDLSEREVANSLEVTGSLLGDDREPEELEDAPQDLAITDELRRISPELDDRWRGAVFALSPGNPDAARHFCTSAREIITQMLAIRAPNNEVLRRLPNCERTPQGNPTRKAKIRFLLHRKNVVDDALEDFVEEDMHNITQLFEVFNKGTHGTAGQFTLRQLSRIKKRVEDGIVFLSQIAS